MEVSGQLHAPVILPRGKSQLYPYGLNVVEKKNISYICRASNPSHQLLAHSYIDEAILVNVTIIPVLATP
jgi:hypothetical protein